MRGFETEEQFEDFVKTDPESGKILAAVVFEHSFTHDDEPLPLQARSLKTTVVTVLCALEKSYIGYKGQKRQKHSNLLDWSNHCMIPCLTGFVEFLFVDSESSGFILAPRMQPLELHFSVQCVTL